MFFLTLGNKLVHLLGMHTSVAASFGVLRQERHPREGLAAGGTRILLHVRVRLQVRPQIRPVGEGPVAVSAGKWFFSCVRPDVPL